MALCDTSDLEISDWLNVRPAICRITELGSGWESELLTNRAANHIRRETHLPIPSGSQIHFETASRNLAISDLELTASAIILILYQKIGHAKIEN